MNKLAARTILASVGAAMFVAATKTVLHGQTSRRRDLRDLRDRRDFAWKVAGLQERLKLALEVADVATWDYDPELDCFECDRRSMRLFGFAAGSKVSYRDFLQRVHPEDRAAVEAALDTAINTRSDYRVIYRIVDETAGVRIVLARGRAVYAPDGAVRRFFGAALDITNERAAQEALVRADKLALAGRFTGAIAHDVANPIAAALLLLYLARSNAAMPADLQNTLSAAESELSHAALICQNALAMFRDTPKSAATNLCSVTEGVVSLQTKRLQELGIELRTDFRCDSEVQINSSELRQILGNLIANSIDAMSAASTRKLYVRVRRGSDWKRHEIGYRIIVADTGCGIPTHIRGNLFVPFRTTKTVDGTGLGLWIINQLVTKHGGSIKVRSRTRNEAGSSGTAISLWLPHAVTASPVSAQPSVAHVDAAAA